MTTAAKRRCRQVVQQIGAGDQQRRHAERADDARELCPGAGRFGYRRARGTAADREALEETGGEVRRAKPDHFLVGIHRPAQAVQHRHVTAHWCRQRTPAPRRRHRSGPGPRSAIVDPRQMEGGQALGQRAQDGDAGGAGPDRSTLTTTVAPTTAISTPGRRLLPFSSRMTTSAPAPMAKAVQLTLPSATALPICQQAAQRSVGFDGKAQAASATG